MLRVSVIPWIFALPNNGIVCISTIVLKRLIDTVQPTNIGPVHEGEEVDNHKRREQMKVTFSQQLPGRFRVLGGLVYGRLSALEGPVLHRSLLGRISHIWKENGIQVNVLLCF